MPTRSQCSAWALIERHSALLVWRSVSCICSEILTMPMAASLYGLYMVHILAVGRIGDQPVTAVSCAPQNRATPPMQHFAATRRLAAGTRLSIMAFLPQGK